jgi:uncharacterized protein YjbI with pentapeptide repeats
VDDQQQSRWRPTRRQLLWTGGIVAALVVAVLIGYRYGITLWDWIKLLVVPAVIAGGGLWFNRQQREREVEIADRRAQDEALQAYLDQMSNLLLEKDLRTAEKDSEVRSLARARTLTVLGRLDPSRKTEVMQFLLESALIQSVDDRDPIIALADAELSDAYLVGINLSQNNLAVANLSRADLRGANLRHAGLVGTDLIEADLFRADLTGADLHIANLSGAILGEANLEDARRLTEGQISTAATFKGATMPNGQKYEDWLKDQEDRKETQ